MLIATRYKILRNVEANGRLDIPLEEKPCRVATLIDEAKFLASGGQLKHNDTVFLEDRWNDWQWANGQFRYYSRVAERADVVVAFETAEVGVGLLPPDVKAAPGPATSPAWLPVSLPLIRQLDFTGGACAAFAVGAQRVVGGRLVLLTVSDPVYLKRQDWPEDQPMDVHVFVMDENHWAIDAEGHRPVPELLKSFGCARMKHHLTDVTPESLAKRLPFRDDTVREVQGMLSMAGWTPQAIPRANGALARRFQAVRAEQRVRDERRQVTSSPSAWHQASCRLCVRGNQEPVILPGEGEALMRFLAPINAPEIRSLFGEEAARFIPSTAPGWWVTEGERVVNEDAWTQERRYLWSLGGQQFVAALNVSLQSKKGRRRPEATVSNVYVNPAWRRQGLARTLIGVARQDFPDLTVDRSMTSYGAALFLGQPSPALSRVDAETPAASTKPRRLKP